MNKQYVLGIIDSISPEWSRLIARRHELKSRRNPKRRVVAEQYQLTKEQKNEIDQFFLVNYGEKIPYFWHQYYAAHSGKFDYRYFPELLYIPEFERFQNQDKGAVSAFSDKNLLPLAAKVAGVKMPTTIVSCTNGILRDGENSIISPSMAAELIKRNGKCFVKPSVDSCSGQGCRIIKENDDVLFTDNTLIVININGVFKHNFVVQELVRCHKSIQVLYPGSVNTFRVITYLWRGDVEMMPIIIRIGQGGHYLDNAHQGGMFCAVNNDGTMGQHAVTEFNDQFTKHPDTHTVFSTHRIEHVHKMIVAAKKMHATIPQLGVVNWDFTIDEQGEPVLIEANCRGGSIWLPQMAHGISGFGEKTSEVLQWLKFMKGLKTSERRQFSGGEIK